MRSGRGAPRRRSMRRSPGPINQKGELRRAITLMRRAYPQHLTAGGQQLPAEILQVIFPLTYWESDSARVGRAGTRSIPDRGADRAGVHVRSEDPLRGERLGPDADRAGDRPAARAHARARDFTTDRLTDPELNIQLGHLLFLAARRSSSAAPTTRSPATTPARTASSAGRPSGPAWTRTSSSTTSRSPKRRTTSSGSSAPRRTTGCCTGVARFDPPDRRGCASDARDGRRHGESRNGGGDKARCKEACDHEEAGRKEAGRKEAGRKEAGRKEGAGQEAENFRAVVTGTTTIS